MRNPGGSLIRSSGSARPGAGMASARIARSWTATGTETRTRARFAMDGSLAGGLPDDNRIRAGLAPANTPRPRGTSLGQDVAVTGTSRAPGGGAGLAPGGWNIRTTTARNTTAAAAMISAWRAKYAAGEMRW